MDWVKQLLAKHTDTDGKVDSDAFLAAVTAEAPKHSVPKSEFNAKNDALKAATADLDALKKSTGDVDALKKQITEASDKAAKAQADYDGLVKSTAIKDAITKAGGTDVDYIAYKLGDIKTDEIENKLKDLQRDLPNYFPKPDDKDGKGGKGDDKGKSGGGFKTIDNKLNDGENQTEMDKMSATLDAAMGLTSDS